MLDIQRLKTSLHGSAFFDESDGLSSDIQSYGLYMIPSYAGGPELRPVIP